MAEYRNSFNGRIVESATALGSPYYPIPNTGKTYEFAVKTADAILLEVGDDPVLAQEALDAENAREFPPRKVLSAKLQKIIDDAES